MIAINLNLLIMLSFNNLFSASSNDILYFRDGGAFVDLLLLELFEASLALSNCYGKYSINLIDIERVI